jgi:hypothetical protein
MLHRADDLADQQFDYVICGEVSTSESAQIELT